MFLRKEMQKFNGFVWESGQEDEANRAGKGRGQDGEEITRGRPHCQDDQEEQKEEGFDLDQDDEARPSDDGT